MKENLDNLISMFKQSVDLYPKRTALIFGSKKITYQDLWNICLKLAYSFRHKLGIEQNDIVGIWLPNIPEFVYSFFATLLIGGIVCPINAMFKREEARFVLEDSQAKALIVSIDKIEDAQNILSRVSSLKYAIGIPRGKKDKGIEDFYALIEEGKLWKVSPVEKDKWVQIIYTSGTTGFPKGVILTHKNLVSNVKDCIKVIRITKRDCFICVLPLFHSFSSTVCMLLPLSCGAKTVIMRAVRPFKRVIRAIFKHRVTIFVGVPSIYNILSQIKISKFKLFLSYLLNPLRVCISGAASLPSQTLEKFEKRFRRPLLEGYGLTEASPVVSLNPIKKRKPNSVGIPLPSISVKVVDKENRALGPGEIGELVVKGPNIMVGYYKRDEETKRVLKEGWLYTGDLAKIDKEGYIYIMGRLKEMINVRGFNVYPKEIEDLLYRHPKVKEASVVGISHKRRGEVPIAFVVAKDKVEEKELIQYLKANLASYKLPVRIIFKDYLPKNPAGKILKKELQKEGESIFS